MPLEPWVMRDDGTLRSLVDGTVITAGSGRGTPPVPPGEETYVPTVLGRKPSGTLVTGQTINEASGGADSRLHPDTWWSHSDGGSPHIYALGYAGSPTPSDAVEMKKAVELTGVDMGTGQWEDMTYDLFAGRRKMWVANCGGNTPVNSFKAFHFDEPTSIATPTTIRSQAVTTYWFKYPVVEAYDCETMMCDPLTGRVYFLTKAAIGTAQVYAAPATLTARASATATIVYNQLTPITTGNFTKAGNLTGGDFNPDGTALYVANNNSRGFKYAVNRNGAGVITGFTFSEEFFVPRPTTTSGTTITAETLFVTADGTRLVRNSEGPGSQIISLAIA